MTGLCALRVIIEYNYLASSLVAHKIYLAATAVKSPEIYVT
jgi:hypothetical protein